jgi:hypothetical protein
VLADDVASLDPASSLDHFRVFLITRVDLTLDWLPVSFIATVSDINVEFYLSKRRNKRLDSPKDLTHCYDSRKDYKHFRCGFCN